MDLNISTESNIAKKRLLIKIFTIFLSVMLLLTFFSNTINNFSLPKVKVKDLIGGALDKDITATGVVDARKSTNIYIDESMRVLQLYVNSGENVEKGQILAVLDKSEFEEKLTTEQIKYKKLEIALKKAENNELDVKNARYDLELQKLEVGRLEKIIESAEVKAPISGRINEIGIVEGSFTDKYKSAISITDSNTDFEVKFTVSNSSAKSLEIGEKVEIIIGSKAGEKIEGSILSIAGNEKVKGEQKEITVSFAADNLIGGEIAEVYIRMESKHYNILVPNTAISKSITGDFVFVLKEEKGPLGNQYFVRRASVTIEDSDDLDSAVISGLDLSEKIVVESDKYITEGSKVSVIE